MDQLRSPLSQGAPLPVHRVGQDFKLPQLFDWPLIGFTSDWFGEPPAAAADFILAANQTCLFFGARCEQTPCFERRAASGEFFEGLWLYDVAELFIREPGTLRYQEWNLAPNGAYWSMYFSDILQRAKTEFRSPGGVQTYSKIELQSWQAALSIPFSAFSFPLNPGEPFFANVPMIINHAVKEQYLTWAKIAEPQPAFHRPAKFVLCREL